MNLTMRNDRRGWGGLAVVACLSLEMAVLTQSVMGQGFYGVSRVTPMAPARGLFFSAQGIGPRPKLTPTVSTFRSPGPLLAEAKKSTATKDRMDPKVLAKIRARAVRGIALDQYRMGLILARGLMGEADMVQAKRWFTAAAERKYAPAVAALKHLASLEESRP